MARKKGKGRQGSKPSAAAKNGAADVGVSSSTTGSIDELRQEQSKAESLDSTDELPQEQSKAEPLDSIDELRQEQRKAEPLDSIDELPQEQSKTEPLDSNEIEGFIDLSIFNALEPGDYAPLLGILNDVCLRHESSALIHGIQCSLYHHIASKLYNSVEREEHLKNAIKSGKQAVLLSPKSVYFAVRYAGVLCAVENFSEAVRQCERALSIDNPIDPAKDTVVVESYRKDLTAEQRIESQKEYLQKIREYSKIALEEEERSREIQEPVEMERLLREFEKWRKSSADMENIQPSLYWKERLAAYINTMSDEQKLGLLETRVSDFKTYLSSFKADDILSEALSFAEKNKTWKFWACCCCDDKFVDSASHLHHLKQNHMGNLSSELESVVPVEVHVHQVEKLVNGQCKPVDTPAVVKMIESRSKCPISDDQKWPLSDDSERAEILERIHGIVQLLLKHKYLAESHLDKLMQYTEEEVQKCVPALQLLIKDLGKPPHRICFLGASQLKTILQFLQELAGVCGLNSSFNSSTDDALGANQNQGCEINDGISYTGESLRILLHDPSVTSASLFLLFGIDPIEERLASWTDLRRNRKHQGMEVFQVLENLWGFLQGMYEAKRKYLLSGEGALQQMKCLSRELGNIDAMLLRSIADMKKPEIKLARLSANDYRSIMIPLLRTFMRVQLEDLVDKDVLEKSEAAREALLRELALENNRLVKEQLNKKIQGRMHVETREKLVNKEKEQLNKEIQERMNRTKELDMENGQLNNEIQERMNRTKELDTEKGQLNNEIQERMNRTKALDMEKGQLNNEIHERMNRTKEQDMEKGQLNKEIQERMDRIKELDKEVQTSTS